MGFIVLIIVLAIAVHIFLKRKSVKANKKSRLKKQQIVIEQKTKERELEQNCKEARIPYEANIAEARSESFENVGKSMKIVAKDFD